VRPAAGPTGWLLVQLALVAATGLAVGLAFARVYEQPADLVMPMAVAALTAAALVAGLSVGRRWTASATGLAAAAAFPLLATIVVARAAPTPVAVLATMTALHDAPHRTLSMALPVASSQLVLGVAVVYAAVVAAGELAVRRRAPAWPLGPLVAATAVPPLLGAGGPTTAPALLVALVALLGALVLVRAATPAPRDPNAQTGLRDPNARTDPDPGTVTVAGRPAGGPHLPRALPLGLAVLAAVAVLAPALATLVPGTDRPRLDPRSVPAGSVPDTLDDPLAMVDAQLGAPRTEVQATVEAPAGLSLFRTTVLDRYDGVSFRPTLLPAPAGSTLPPPAEPPPPGSQPVTQRLTLATAPGAHGVLVPAAGVPTAVRGAAAMWDPRSTTLRLDPAAAPAGTTLTVESLVRAVTDDELAAARRDRGGADADEAARPVAQAGVITRIAADEVAARSSAAESGSPDARMLRALQGYFGDRARFTVTPRSVCGPSLRQVTDLLTPPPPGSGPKDGSVTCFATAYAVMARTLGFASRVAVGYRAPTPAPGEPYRLTNRDAFAWAEVKLDGLGWVAMIALPRVGDTAPARPAPSTTTPTTAPAKVLPPPPASTTTVAPDTDERAAAPGTGTGWWRGVALAGAGGIGLLLALPGGLAVAAMGAATLRRRRRAGAPEPGLRVLGAWHEALDQLCRVGVPVAPSMTAAEVTGATRAALGRAAVPGLDRLGTLVNQARFAPTGVGADAADESWALVGGVRAEVTRRAAAAAPPTRPGRLRRWLDPRSPRRWSRRRPT
jgi:hypothetical protein